MIQARQDFLTAAVMAGQRHKLITIRATTSELRNSDLSNSAASISVASLAA
jgi:hypothetical protein